MKKGFTLIELLAVIVILAIIALIATPIILGIINDARRESNERSAELYASAVRNAIAAYQLTGTTSPTSFDDLDIQYDGNVVCATEELYEDGSFYIANCTVNGGTVEYTYGEKQVTQVYKPQYYAWNLEGIVGETSAPSNPSRVPPTGKNYYLGYDVLEGIVSTAYVCFVRNGTEYCLKGLTDNATYETNKTVLLEAFGASACNFEESYICSADGMEANPSSDNHVYVGVDSSICFVGDASNDFGCY